MLRAGEQEKDVGGAVTDLMNWRRMLMVAATELVNRRRMLTGQLQI